MSAFGVLLAGVLSAGLSQAYVDKVTVSLVLVPVVVRDEGGRPLAGLSEGDFTVLDEGVPQKITAFGTESRPVSIVLALDTSWSMRSQAMALKRAAVEFVKGQRAGTAFALECFNDVVTLEQDFTEDGKEAEAAVAAVRVEGENTALYDALAAAAHQLDRREGARIAVLFTDGTETVHPQDEAESRLSGAIADAVKRDVSVYTVGFGTKAATWVLDRVAAETGGEAFKAGSEKDLAAAFAHVAESVGSRYLIGYAPPSAGAGGFRKIEVKVARPGARVVARSGYYAGSDK